MSTGIEAITAFASGDFDKATDFISSYWEGIFPFAYGLQIGRLIIAKLMQKKSSELMPASIGIMVGALKGMIIIGFWTSLSSYMKNVAKKTQDITDDLAIITAKVIIALSAIYYNIKGYKDLLIKPTADIQAVKKLTPLYYYVLIGLNAAFSVVIAYALYQFITNDIANT